MKTVLDVFKHHITIPMNRALVLKVIHYVNTFKNKDSETINFLGGNLLGQYHFKWIPTQEGTTWLEDVLQIKDIDTLRHDLHNTEHINPQFHVSSEVYNLSFIYMAYALYSSPLLTKDEQYKGAYNTLWMLLAKHLSAVHTRSFKHKSNLEIAASTYESLNLKWGLKKTGSWGALLDSKVTEVLAEASNPKTKTPYYIIFNHFNDDLLTVGALNSLRTWASSIMIYLNDRFREVRASEARITASSKYMTVEGEKVLKDNTSRYERMRIRIVDLALERNAFIVPKLINTTILTVKSVNETALLKSLEQVVLDMADPKRKEATIKTLEDVVVYTLDVARMEKLDLNDIPRLAIKLRNLFKSSRANDPLHLEIRSRIGEIVGRALDTTNKNAIVSTRIGVIMYITLRTLIIK